MSHLARGGVWTPWASVLCLSCDYDALQGTDRAKSYAAHFAAVSEMQRDSLVTRPDGNLEATCDACKCACWVRDDVALLQGVGFAVAGLDWNGPWGWELQQTGGMCAALVFTTAFAREIVVTAMDGCFVIGEYVKGTDESYWDNPLRTWESAHFWNQERDEMAAVDELSSLVAECARQVVALVQTPTPDPEAVARVERLNAVREEHQAAAGAKCQEGPDGMCLQCETEMTTCGTCGGIAYHREGCPQIEGTS